MANFNIRYKVVIEDSIDIEADDVRDALSALAKQHTEERLTQVGMVQKFLITEVKNYNLEEY
jgi:hypothetical protein